MLTNDPNKGSYLNTGRLTTFTRPHHDTSPRGWITEDKHWPSLEVQTKRKWKQDTWLRQGSHGNQKRGLLCLLYFGQNNQQAEPSAPRSRPPAAGSLLHSPFPCRAPASARLRPGESDCAGLWFLQWPLWLPKGFNMDVIEKKNNTHTCKISSVV